MLLRRITKHVTDQNWFAVFIDFLIVVVGVFIGIQVANWNAASAERNTDKQLLNRLSNDLRGMRNEYSENQPTVRRMHDGWMNAFRALENCKITSGHRESINYALSQYQRTIVISIQQSAYDEMQFIGAFSRIKNVELQNQISILYSSLESDDEADKIGRINQLAAGRIMWKSIAFSFSNDDPGKEEHDTWATAAFDPLAHCDNLELRGAVWELVDVNRDWLSVRKDKDEFMASILSELEQLK